MDQHGSTWPPNDELRWFWNQENTKSRSAAFFGVLENGHLHKSLNGFEVVICGVFSQIGNFITNHWGTRHRPEDFWVTLRAFKMIKGSKPQFGHSNSRWPVRFVCVVCFFFRVKWSDPDPFRPRAKKIVIIVWLDKKKIQFPSIKNRQKKPFEGCLVESIVASFTRLCRYLNGGVDMPGTFHQKLNGTLPTDPKLRSSY